MKQIMFKVEIKTLSQEIYSYDPMLASLVTEQKKIVRVEKIIKLLGVVVTKSRLKSMFVGYYLVHINDLWAQNQFTFYRLQGALVKTIHEISFASSCDIVSIAQSGNLWLTS